MLMSSSWTLPASRFQGISLGSKFINHARSHLQLFNAIANAHAVTTIMHAPGPYYLEDARFLTRYCGSRANFRSAPAPAMTMPGAFLSLIVYVLFFGEKLG